MSRFWNNDEMKSSLHNVNVAHTTFVQCLDPLLKKNPHLGQNVHGLFKNLIQTCQAT